MKPKPLFDPKEAMPFVTKERGEAICRCWSYLNEDTEVEPSDADWEHWELFGAALKHKLNRINEQQPIQVG